jgi:hypothetical protein
MHQPLPHPNKVCMGGINSEVILNRPLLNGLNELYDAGSAVGFTDGVAGFEVSGSYPTLREGFVAFDDGSLAVVYLFF